MRLQPPVAASKQAGAATSLLAPIYGGSPRALTRDIGRTRRHCCRVGELAIGGVQKSVRHDRFLVKPDDVRWRGQEWLLRVRLRRFGSGEAR